MKEIFLVKNLSAGQVIAGFHIVLCRLNSQELKESWMKLKQDFIICRWFYAVTAAVTSSCRCLSINHALLFAGIFFFPGHACFVFKEPLKSWLRKIALFCLAWKPLRAYWKRSLFTVPAGVWDTSWVELSGPQQSHTLAGRNEPRQLWQTTVKPM